MEGDYHMTRDNDAIDVPFIVIILLRKPLWDLVIAGQARQRELAEPNNCASPWAGSLSSVLHS